MFEATVFQIIAEKHLVNSGFELKKQDQRYKVDILTLFQSHCRTIGCVYKMFFVVVFLVYLIKLSAGRGFKS